MEHDYAKNCPGCQPCPICGEENQAHIHELRELRDLRTVAHRALDLFTRWQSEHDREMCQFAEWDGLRDALEAAGCFRQA